MNIPTYILGLEEPINKINYLKNFGIDAKWFKGITPDNQSDELFREYCSDLYTKFGNKSGNRISITHMMIWELAVKNNNKYTLIFEDDVLLYKKFKKYIHKCIENTPDDFDALFLGACAGYEKNSLQNLLFNNNKSINIINDYICEPISVLGVHAYIISLSGAKKMLELIKGKMNNLLNFYIDGYINKFYVENKLKIYICYPELAIQTSTNSVSNSVNTQINSPWFFNRLFSQIQVDRYVTLDYALNFQVCRLGSININLMKIIFFIFGIIFFYFYFKM